MCLRLGPLGMIGDPFRLRFLLLNAGLWYFLVGLRFLFVGVGLWHSVCGLSFLFLGVGLWHSV